MAVDRKQNDAKTHRQHSALLGHIPEVHAARRPSDPVETTAQPLPSRGFQIPDSPGAINDLRPGKDTLAKQVSASHLRAYVVRRRSEIDAAIGHDGGDPAFRDRHFFTRTKEKEWAWADIRRCPFFRQGGEKKRGIWGLSASGFPTPRYSEQAPQPLMREAGFARGNVRTDLQMVEGQSVQIED